MKRIFFHLIFIAAVSFLVFSCTSGNDNNANTTVNGPDEFRENVLKLRRAGLLDQLSDRQLDSLITIFRNDSLNGMKEILVRSGKMLKINSSLNGKAPHEIYATIFDTLAKHFPQLKADEMHCTYVPTSAEKKDTNWVLLHARFGIHSYDKNMYYLRRWPIDELMYKLFNTYLADIHSDERLYLSQFFCKDCNKKDDYMGKLDVSNFGLMLLKKNQADSILAITDLAIEPMNEFAIYTTQQTSDALASFERSGLAGKEMEDWYQQKKEDVIRGTLYSQEDLFDFLDTLFCTVSFDTINDYNPYEDILRHMVKISKGNFAPTGISDQHANPSTHTVRFTLGGKVYETDADQHLGMIWPGIIDEVNSALGEQKVKGKFYSVFVREKVTIVVFIPDENIDQAKKSGFFDELEEGTPKTIKATYDVLPAS
ncbi:MAG: hypothetical protein HY064_14920 [Bacteroidetes bacterium]|nr:hypothetical protein [Bacteroidota bacterium]